MLSSCDLKGHRVDSDDYFFDIESTAVDARVAQHARIYSGYGITFFREMIAPPEDFHWISTRVFPRACYLADVIDFGGTFLGLFFDDTFGDLVKRTLRL